MVQDENESEDQDEIENDENENENEPELDDVYDKEQQELAETPRDTNPIFPDTRYNK